MLLVVLCSRFGCQRAPATISREPPSRRMPATDETPASRHSPQRHRPPFRAPAQLASPWGFRPSSSTRRTGQGCSPHRATLVSADIRCSDSLRRLRTLRSLIPAPPDFTKPGIPSPNAFRIDTPAREGFPREGYVFRFAPRRRRPVERKSDLGVGRTLCRSTTQSSPASPRRSWALRARQRLLTLSRDSTRP
jgi:hypothetical protein